jgi:hypothetical protein
MKSYHPETAPQTQVSMGVSALLSKEDYRVRLLRGFVRGTYSQ